MGLPSGPTKPATLAELTVPDPHKNDTNKAMKRELLIATALTFSTIASAEDTAASAEDTAASAEDTAIWEGVYARSGKTIKAGEWMGIGGAAGVVVGTGMVIGGAASGGSALAQGDVDGAGGGVGVAVGGIAVGIAGYGVFAIGPTLTAGGAMRQSKAIRKLNPSAPYPWLGTSAWVLWAGGVSGSANPVSGALLFSGAYVLAAMQRGKNRMYWDARAKARLEDMERSNFSMAMAPMSTHETRGLMLYGTF